MISSAVTVDGTRLPCARRMRWEWLIPVSRAMCLHDSPVLAFATAIDRATLGARYQELRDRRVLIDAPVGYC